MPPALKILMAPLDWGLGHTTRCIPLIRYFRNRGDEVVVAAEGASAVLLRQNFPDLELLPLEGYRIRYSRKPGAFTLKILSQVPAILAAVRKERRWLDALLSKTSFDLVISDNRYGLYHDTVPCVIMTHQLQVRSGRGAMADALLRQLHYRMLAPFRACWVVDEAAAGGLSGMLAHPRVLPSHAVYIGILSQFDPVMPVWRQAVPPFVILILLSGPEPMRSLLEQQLLAQAATLDQYRFIFVAGNPLGCMPDAVPAHITYHTHSTAARLSELIDAAHLVVCRSGYSTLMDLVRKGKRALLIPTPGQTEQEYLARYLSGKPGFRATTQQALRLEADIAKALTEELPVRPLLQEDKLKERLDALLASMLS